jgi:hypothetical protein
LALAGLGLAGSWHPLVICNSQHLARRFRLSVFRLRIPTFIPPITHLYRYRLSRTSTAVAHISHTSRSHLPPIMSARQQQMGRPGGARFAQFKLVLLGMPNLRPTHFTSCMLTTLSQANPPSARCATTEEAYQSRTRHLTHGRVRSSSASSRTSSTTTGNPPSAPLSSPKQSPSMTRLPSSSRSGIPQVKSATSPWPPCTTATPTALL